MTAPNEFDAVMRDVTTALALEREAKRVWRDRCIAGEERARVAEEDLAKALDRAETAEGRLAFVRSVLEGLRDRAADDLSRAIGRTMLEHLFGDEQEEGAR